MTILRSRLTKVIAIMFATGCIVLGGLWLTAKPAPAHPFFEGFTTTPLVIAHQGGDWVWPGNTLYAFEQSVALGVDVLEMDAHASADGELIIIHDDTVDRTTDGSGAIKDLTIAELKALDAAYNWSRDDGATYPYRGEGLTIPTLEEIFQAFPSQKMNIEIKQTEPPITQSLCQLIYDYSMETQVLVASFHNEAMAEFRAACPEVATSASRHGVTMFVVLNTLRLGGTYSPVEVAHQVPEYQSDTRIVSPSLIAAAHRRNLHIHIWTPNERKELARFIDLGVDGIITDRPDILMELLDRSSDVQ
ncbi:MAG: glycerophosphodiester phosphodiesterase [Chloroflexi bacterium AL-W]|nr:glycerophosphodiester phosphodiesterase [Chloroflexi bacterium AL-N1]NOK70004.1 glycerophosphodiester phosphodiesterase [Chloroflexi bacterium AL-N10]NOK73698.1 glycerophosphodiester phosphodiesterase [Chloroflexi bacterium AL-N5]NOK85536.1 glycerophosphodiester phosphodiesterase [Chloroflexi bacterium AL-W]NOK91737.1 glycerophosphodiester phosphodiesterase [Chloroflexi bacterium AL-N15]